MAGRDLQCLNPCGAAEKTCIDFLSDFLCSDFGSILLCDCSGCCSERLGEGQATGVFTEANRALVETALSLQLPPGLLGKADLWQLIFVDDFSWHLYGPDFEYFMWFIIFFYSVLRVPFAWHKFQGGQEYEWVGLWINIKVRSTGLSQKRKSWLIQ